MPIVSLPNGWIAHRARTVPLKIEIPARADIEQQRRSLDMEPQQRVLLIRHGQAVHNATDNLDLRDPELTALGERQAAALATETIAPDQCDLIVCSPLRRTIQTALLGFGKAIRQRKLRVILHPAFQENGPHAADTGSDVETLRREFAEWDDVIDYSLVQGDDWISKAGFYGTEEDEIKARAAAARQYLSKRPERAIAVISHMGFLCSLLGFRPIEGIDNCEMREHVFKKRSGSSSPEHICLSPLPTRVQDVSAVAKEETGITVMSRSSSISTSKSFNGHL